MKVVRSIQGQQPHIRSMSGGAELSGMHVRPRVADHAVNIFGAAGHIRKTGEREQQDRQKDAERPFPEPAHGVLLHFVSESTEKRARTISSARVALHNAYILPSDLGP